MLVTAHRDNALSARVVRRVRLHYAYAVDHSLDRPDHVRAGSGLAWLDDRLAVVQDDANFVAVVDPLTGAADCITLPHGPGQRRQFADALGNKPDKFDFEAIVRVRTDQDDLLLVIGSGSTAQRERVVLIDTAHSTTGISVLHLPDFYAALRRTTDFAGSEMNIEGALQMSGKLRLIGRGNGLAGESLDALDATCDIDLAAFLAHARAPHRYPAPLPTNVMRFELGTLHGMRLSFTDATVNSASSHAAPPTFYLAAAEDSPDTIRDGAVVGSVVGVIDNSAQLAARYTEILDEDGLPLRAKAEGIAFSRDDPTRAYIVLDVDAADKPSEMCELALEGTW
jgi:hypothetical protein